MNIGIIGAGNVGGTTARLFIDAGHEVAISNSRGPAPEDGAQIARVRGFGMLELEIACSSICRLTGWKLGSEQE